MGHAFSKSLPCNSREHIRWINCYTVMVRDKESVTHR
jgi:hypothetical protein